MARLGVEQLIKRCEKAWGIKEQWRGLLDEAYLYTRPQQNTLSSGSQGEKKNTHQFDGTGQISTRRAVNKFVSSVFPAEQNWCLLKAGPGVPKAQQKKQNEKLQAATEAAFSIIHNRSNFQTAITEMVEDMWISTGVMTVQKGRKVIEPVAFNAIPQTQVALEEGPNGSVGAKFRKFTMPGHIIAPTWPDANIPEQIASIIKKEPDKLFEVIECTYTDYDKDKVYYDVVLTKEQARIVSRSPRLDRFVVGRLSRSPNEVNGRGPVLDALPDIKTTNKLVELVLKNATLAVSGPYTVVDDGVLNPDNVVIGPLRMIPVARNNGHPAGPSIAPLARSGEFDVAYLEYERLSKAIRAALLDNDLPEYSGSPKTAAEILQRVRAYIDELGAYYGRVQREIVVPTMQNVLDILANDWQMIDPIVIDGDKVHLEITSPLALQKNIQEVEAVVQALEISKTLFGPEQTALVFNVKEIVPWIARKLGVPENLILGEVEQQQGIEAAGAALSAVENVQPGSGLSLLQNSLR